MSPWHHALSFGHHCVSHQLRELSITVIFGVFSFPDVTFLPGILTLKGAGGVWRLWGAECWLQGQAKLVAVPEHISGHPWPSVGDTAWSEAAGGLSLTQKDSGGQCWGGLWDCSAPPGTPPLLVGQGCCPVRRRWSFIHSTNIYRAPPVFQALSEVFYVNYLHLILITTLCSGDF